MFVRDFGLEGFCSCFWGEGGGLEAGGRRVGGFTAEGSSPSCMDESQGT